MKNLRQIFQYWFIKNWENKKEEEEGQSYQGHINVLSGSRWIFELHPIDVDPRKEATKMIEEYRANSDEFWRLYSRTEQVKTRNIVIWSLDLVFDWLKTNKFCKYTTNGYLRTSQEYKQERRLSFKYSLLLEKVNNKAKDEVLTLHQQHYSINEILSLCHIDNVTWR